MTNHRRIGLIGANDFGDLPPPENLRIFRNLRHSRKVVTLVVRFLLRCYFTVLRLNLVGRRFGRLTVLEYLGSRNGKSVWQCQCDCGKICETDSRNIQKRKSCGCTRKLFAPPRLSVPVKVKRLNTGHLSTRAAWRSLVMRAALRQIQLDPRWLNFGYFLSDMGPRPSPTHGICRNGLVGKFEPGNCVWATTAERGRFRRQLRAAGVRRYASEFMVGGKFSWDKWHKAGSPDYEIENA